MKQNNERKFWSSLSGIYERIMRKDSPAYEEVYNLIRPCVKDKNVLELATGTGMIARNISAAARCVVATDFSAEMISQAKKLATLGSLCFEVQDACALPYASQNFDVVIISNALHIMPCPEKALAEIHRVLRDDGVLIAPTFTHANMGNTAKIKSGIMKLLGFPLGHAWSPNSYIEFLNENGFLSQKNEVLQSSFPLTYVECIKRFEKSDTIQDFKIGGNEDGSCIPRTPYCSKQQFD